MNVLMLTHRLPYAPNRGDRNRAYHLVRFLASRFDVHLVSLVHDEDEAARASSLKDRVATVSIARCSRLAGLVRGSLALSGRTPLTHALLHSATIRDTLERLTARYHIDVVLAYGSGMAQFALKRPLQSIPLILDLVDVDSEKWREYAARSRPPLRWLYRREYRRLRTFEAAAARSAFATLVINDRELTALRTIAPAANAVVVPIGIDLEQLRPPCPPALEERVLFCGVMNYRPNAEGAVWFLRDVWPLIRAMRPAATLSVVGPAPSRRLRRLARLAGGVEVTGYVDDVRPYFWRSAVTVAPLQLARGMQTKVLDAAAAGLPAVVTSVVHDGLPREVGAACGVADDARSFAVAVAELLRLSPAERRARAARVDLEALSWSRQLASVPALFEAAGNLRPRAGIPRMTASLAAPLTGSQDSGRHTRGDNARWDRSGNNGARPNHAAWTDVRHDDRAGADPRALPDPDESAMNRLVANRSGDIVGAVSVRPAEHVHAGSQQSVPLNMSEPDVAMRSDVHALIDVSIRVGEDRAEFDGRRRSAPAKRAGEEGPTDVLAADPRNEGQQLRGTLQSPVAVKQPRPQPV